MKLLVVLAIVLGVALAGTDDRSAHTVQEENVLHEDGTFKYHFESTNGIAVQQSGSGHASSGSASWVAPEGIPVHLKYVADENGYQPHGDHLPTSPPIPEYILKALEYIRTHPPKETIHGQVY